MPNEKDDEIPQPPIEVDPEDQASAREFFSHFPAGVLFEEPQDWRERLRREGGRRPMRASLHSRLRPDGTFHPVAAVAWEPGRPEFAILQISGAEPKEVVALAELLYPETPQPPRNAQALVDYLLDRVSSRDAWTEPVYLEAETLGEAAEKFLAGRLRPRA